MKRWLPELALRCQSYFSMTGGRIGRERFVWLLYPKMVFRMELKN
jgi:hypothetical protein